MHIYVDGKRNGIYHKHLQTKQHQIAFRINNTVGNRLMHKQQTTNKYNLSGICRLTCPVCNKAYVGQTGRFHSKVQ